MCNRNKLKKIKVDEKIQIAVSGEKGTENWKQRTENRERERGNALQGREQEKEIEGRGTEEQ